MYYHYFYLGLHKTYVVMILVFVIEIPVNEYVHSNLEKYKYSWKKSRHVQTLILSKKVSLSNANDHCSVAQLIRTSFVIWSMIYLHIYVKLQPANDERPKKLLIIIPLFSDEAVLINTSSPTLTCTTAVPVTLQSTWLYGFR